MNDGSGLSHGNSFSARQSVSLIRYMLGTFFSWADGLPIGCNDGTLATRFCSTDGSGQVHAKTGSLSISIALGGYIDNKYDNQRYLFSFIGNKTSIDQTSTRQAIDDCVALLGGRGVAFSPQITRVSSEAGGTSLKVSWSDERFVRSGYKLYSSADGVSFGPATSLGPAVQTYTDNGVAIGSKRYYKVSVTGTGGESKASRIYGARAGGNARVLIVDGDDRWQFQTAENPACTNHGFCAIAGQNLAGAIFDTANHSAVIDGSVNLTNYSAVVWLCGEESSADEAFSAAEQALVTPYLNGGGNLFYQVRRLAGTWTGTAGPRPAIGIFIMHSFAQRSTAMSMMTQIPTPLFRRPAGYSPGTAAALSITERTGLTTWTFRMF